MYLTVKDILEKYKLWDKSIAECKRRGILEVPFDVKGHCDVGVTLLTEKKR